VLLKVIAIIGTTVFILFYYSTECLEYFKHFVFVNVTSLRVHASMPHLKLMFSILLLSIGH